MKNKTFSFVILFLLLVLGACSKDTTVEEGKKNEPPLVEDKEIVLGDHTINLTQNLIDHTLETVTGNELLIDGSIKELELPKIGQILLNRTISETFPDGFYGKVTQITKEGNNHKIVVASVPLDEAFDRLYIKDSILFDVGELPQTRDVGVKLSSYKDSEGYAGIKLGLKVSSTIGKLEGSIGVGFTFTYHIDIDNKLHKPMASFVLNKRTFSSLEQELKMSTDMKKENGELIREKIGRIPLTPKIPQGVVNTLIFKPELYIDFVVKGTGSFEYNSIINYQKTMSTGIEYKDNQWKVGTNDLPGGVGTFSSTKFSMDGYLFCGFEVGFKAHLFTDELLCVEIPFDIGMDIKAEIPQKEVTDDKYEEFKDVKVTTNLLHLELGVKASSGLFKGLKDLNWPSYAKNFLSHEYYLFPEFENVKAERTSGAMTGIKVRSNPKRDLLLPVKIGYNLYSTKQLLLDEGKWYPYYKEKEFINLLEDVFKENIKWDEEYSIYPKVELPIFGTIIASPKSDIGKIQLLTGGASEINKSSVTCSGTIIKNGNSFPTGAEYGFCYCLSINTPEYAGMKVIANNINNEGVFTANLSALEAGNTYLYRAFLKVDGHIYYGAVNVFTIDKEEVEEGFIVLTGGASEINKSSVTCSGTIIKNGNSFPTGAEYGFCYCLSINTPEYAGMKVIANNINNEGVFTANLSALEAGNTYLYRVFLKVDGQIYYGAVNVFTIDKEEVEEGFIVGSWFLYGYPPMTEEMEEYPWMNLIFDNNNKFSIKLGSLCFFGNYELEDNSKILLHNTGGSYDGELLPIIKDGVVIIPSPAGTTDVWDITKVDNNTFKMNTGSLFGIITYKKY